MSSPNIVTLTKLQIMINIWLVEVISGGQLPVGEKEIFLKIATTSQNGKLKKHTELEYEFK